MLTQRIIPAQAMEEYAEKLNQIYVNDAEKRSRFITIRQSEFNLNSDNSNERLAAYLALASRFITQLNLLKSKLDATNPAPGTVLAILKSIGNLVYVESLQEFESIHAAEKFNDDRMILLKLLHDTVSATFQYYSNPNSQEKLNNLKMATEAFTSVHNSILAPRNHQLQTTIGKGYFAVLGIFLAALAFIGVVGTVTPTLPMLFILKAFGQVSGVVLGLCEVATLTNLYASGDRFFNTEYRKNFSRVDNGASVFFKAAQELREPQPIAENARCHALQLSMQ